MGTPGLTAYCTYPRLARRLPGLADVPEGYICGSVQQRLGLCSRASEGPLASFYETLQPSRCSVHGSLQSYSDLVLVV